MRKSYPQYIQCSLTFPSYFSWLHIALPPNFHSKPKIFQFEKARFIGLELWWKQGISHSVDEQLRSEISRISHNHISKLKSKFMSLCNKSCWKDLGRVVLVNISSIKFSAVEMEALSLVLKFATWIKKPWYGKTDWYKLQTSWLISTKGLYKALLFPPTEGSLFNSYHTRV